MERLDRFLGNSTWFNTFPSCQAISFFQARSDHCPILMDTRPVPPIVRPNTLFRYENCWADNPEVLLRIKELWSTPSRSTLSKLHDIRHFLATWQTNKRLKSNKRISQLNDFINLCLARHLSDSEVNGLLSAKRELDSLMNAKEIYWAQRARTLWLEHGDKNTSFFHARATSRRRKNQIVGLFDDQNTWHTNSNDIMTTAVTYFQTLFSSSSPIIDPSILNNIPTVVTDSMNNELNKDFTSDEIHTAFRDINPRKALGVDGFPSSFFRKHWDILGHEFISLCLGLLRGFINMEEVNRTIIVLIPKIDEPTTMRHLRPISLCTVIYKTVSKVLVNRLKSIIPLCISGNQAAFVHGRNITDNILIAHELIHTLNTDATSLAKWASLKLDMEKAFDRAEWTFLEHVMIRLGFNSNWVSLIMRCVSSVTFQVRVNDSLSRPFKPFRGLRQGDPLSSFLFLFCTQGLSALLNAAQSSGDLPGLCASRNGPRVNHLLFADDCVVFIRTKMAEVQRLRDVLHTYANSSGQAVNFEKSTIFYSRKTPLSL